MIIIAFHKYIHQEMGKGEDKDQRSRRKATAAELARKAAHRDRANDDNAAKKRVANSASIKDAHRNLFKKAA